jgi:3-deoxy-D-manno-octulosonic-acid transferase
LRPLAHSLAALSAVTAAPLLLGAMAVRRDLRVGLRQRFGLIRSPGPGRVWVHGSSVGEALAALRLVDPLRGVGRTVFATASTPTGRQMMRSVMPELPSSLAPLDHPWCVESALKRVEPELLALVETELWPSWIAAARRRSIPVVVVSGRLSDRSFPRYMRVRRFLAPTLRRLDAVGARSDLDAARFVELGVPEERVRITGDLKLEPPGGVATLATDLVRALSEVPVIVAGSTHPGEEEPAHQALAAAEQASLPAALVIAPRHPQRADQIERELRAAGRHVRRRTRLEGAPLSAGEVLILDTLGELSAVYAAASVAFVGGSLVPVGGHNLIEPIFGGCPVVFGPHVHNVRVHAELAESSGAGVRVADAEQLAVAVVDALRDPDARRARVVAGQEALAVHRGTARRTSLLIDEVISGRASMALPAGSVPGQGLLPEGPRAGSEDPVG